MVEPPIPQRRSVRRGLRRDDVTYDGVPAHLLQPLQLWARACLGRESDGETNDGQRQANLMRLAILCRVQVANPRYYLEALINLAEDPYGDADDFLDIVDLHLRLFGRGAKVLRGLLRDGGSALTVAGNPPQLVDRVSDEQQEQFDDAVTPADEAADLLSRAWVKTYGRHPNPTAAWADAIKAVEVLLASIVAPNDHRPQLGKMIGYIVQAPQKWMTTLQQEKVAVLDVFVDMLRVLYRNPGRHSADVATQAQAEASVGLAVLIVTWIRSGTFRRADPPNGAVSP